MKNLCNYLIIFPFLLKKFVSVIILKVLGYIFWCWTINILEMESPLAIPDRSSRITQRIKQNVSQFDPAF